MPFININGQLTEVSQEQFDTYTNGLRLDPLGRDVVTEPNNPAAGGNVTVTPTATSTVLTENTTNNSPGQELNTDYQSVNTSTTGEPITTTTIQNLVNEALAKDAPTPVSETNIDIQALVNEALAKDAPTPVSETNIDTSTIQQLVNDNIAQTTADTTVPVSAEEGYYQQFVSAFQQEQDAPTPTDSPYAPVAAVGDTPLVETAGTVTVEGAGPEFDNATPIETTADAVPVDPADDPTADGAFVETSPGVFQAAEDLPVDPADDPTVDGAFVEQADGSFAAAEDLPVDPATDPTAGGGFVEQADGSFVAAEDLPPTDINGEAFSPTEDPNTPEEVGNVTADTLARDPGSYSAEELNAITAAQGVDDGNVADGGITDQQLFDNEAATGAANAKDRARDQQTLRQQQALQQTSNDWRVKLSLAKNADYLYNAADPGILKPLSSKSGTSGVVFPYTPAINTNYRADYSPYTLTHSNYKGYFYNSSYMDAVNITATFTAQDTLEAEYLLAVIHFFRSVTKMFYGQDTQRGSPPPLVFLSGLGEYQFNQHPCVVSQFTYNLPADVDYIRATSIVNQGISFNNVRSNQSSPVSGLAGVSRLANALLPKGAKASPPAPQMLGKNSSTYVPTKMEMTITLLPVQSRNQVSKVFKLSSYASGNQLKGGFW